jgi:transposase
MQEQLSGLLGLEEYTVTLVEERGDELDLEVELVAQAGCCPRCGRASCEVKDRPLVRVRDLPIAGETQIPCLAQAPLPCRVCSCTFTERHEELPSRQPVTKAVRTAPVREGG